MTARVIEFPRGRQLELPDVPGEATPIRAAGRRAVCSYLQAMQFELSHEPFLRELGVETITVAGDVL